MKLRLNKYIELLVRFIQGREHETHLVWCCWWRTIISLFDSCFNFSQNIHFIMKQNPEKNICKNETCPLHPSNKIILYFYKCIAPSQAELYRKIQIMNIYSALRKYSHPCVFFLPCYVDILCFKLLFPTSIYTPYTIIVKQKTVF